MKLVIIKTLTIVIMLLTFPIWWPLWLVVKLIVEPICECVRAILE